MSPRSEPIDLAPPVEKAFLVAVDRWSLFALPPGHVKIVSGLAHITLPHHPAVYEHVRAWCAPGGITT